MYGTTQFDDDSTDYTSNLAALADLYTTLNGAHTPLSSLQTGVHPDETPALSTLFPPALVRAHSDYTDWEDLVAATPWDLTDYDRLQEIPKVELDAVIAAETTLDSLQALIDRAVTHHVETSSEVEPATIVTTVGRGR